MLNLAILGCGQIGSRHLQSFSLLEEPAEIHLVDTSEQSLQVAEERFAQAMPQGRAGAFHLVRHRTPESLPPTLDAAVIASSSLHRAELCEKLLAACKPGFLILEKFLFPRTEDYPRVSRLLAGRGVPAFVNQWMSATFAFQRIAAWIGGANVDMRVSGRGWGLCCNAVHYIEPFQCLTGHGKLHLDSTDFQEGFQDSKRSGYCELFGSLKIGSEDGSTLELSCDPGPPEDAIHIEISSGARAVRIAFYMDRFECRHQDGAQQWDALYWLPMQSQLTHRFIQQFLTEGRCGLPDLASSSVQHLLVLEPFLAHFRKWNPSVVDACPVT